MHANALSDNNFLNVLINIVGFFFFLILAALVVIINIITNYCYCYHVLLFYLCNYTELLYYSYAFLRLNDFCPASKPKQHSQVWQLNSNLNLLYNFNEFSHAKHMCGLTLFSGQQFTKNIGVDVIKSLTVLQLKFYKKQ